MKPSTTALIDQASAAAEHADRMLQYIAERSDAELDYAPAFGPITSEIVARLAVRRVQRRLTFCPHLSPTAPSPASWLAYAPGRLRCIRCAEEPARRIKGTPEDHRCDSCQRVSKPIHPVIIQIPPIVFAFREEAVCAPPTFVQFGLCRRCWQTEQEAVR